MGEGSTFRDYRGVDGVVEDAEKGPPDERKRNPRGRIGVSRPKSPRPGVRDPGKPREGSEGEKQYGPPMDPPKPQPKKPRPDVKPDPLKPKKG
jgi:hypothetical protein